ncbi:MAG: anti-sigma factor family protein [Desulfosoma sp.]|uniref:anti-sigma factor family protein n=1 Tax=Desulfosoma sp. TaxID=2603217 RepID=UPI0040497978
MRGCKNFEETLILDVFDELPEEQCSRWSAHAAQCDACTTERRRLKQLMQRVKAAGTPEPMPESEALRMRARVRWALNNDGRTFASFKAPSLWHSFAFKPAWATGLILSAVVMVGGLTWIGLPSRMADTDTASGPTVVADQDQEVMENLEFLKELDTVRKLVTVIDQQDQEVPSAEILDNAPAPVSSQLEKEAYA